MPTAGKSYLEIAATTAQILSIVAGVVISVLSFNAARVKEAEALGIEAAKPFLELRQRVYIEAAKLAAVLSDPKNHTAEELSKSKKRFRELYIVELSMVESKEVAAKMIALAKIIDPTLFSFTPEQIAAYDLSRTLGKSFVPSWGIKEK